MTMKEEILEMIEQMQPLLAPRSQPIWIIAAFVEVGCDVLWHGWVGDELVWPINF